MTNAKHTPGPWLISVDYDYPFHLCIVSSGGTIARIEMESTVPADREWHDAHLISAAPDMLVALEKIANWVECESPGPCAHCIALAAIANSNGKY